ncbi:IclR family transcriptional regulator [Alicyclobacillus fastidiosus]|uniref:IclR family transcriptional regulator n=1 Tax=Alicyclobacillus fastidiosus TaxID=392011 RepID=A0ABY6ZRH4_9BACL|nr:IclR family transcriptional regulator [Alicyclobacillus fastidiosus]WAH44726.1 IclR family transcriptional regulator [Alicyclobacillus fastidiosus]
MQSLERGLKLLELIAEQSGGCTAKWLSKVSNINLSTCYHLLNTLDVAGYVEKDKVTQNYFLTYKVAYLNNLVQSRRAIPQKITTLAGTLAQKSRETAYVSTWDRGEVVIRYIVESDRAVKVRSLYVGYWDHGFLRAMGKAILAHVSADELDEYRATHIPEQRTPNSKVNWGEIEEEMRITRGRGYSVDNQEYEIDVCGIAAPIFQFDGSVWGAISIAMPSSRFNDSDDTMIAYLKGEALAASLSLGYQLRSFKEV